MDDELVDQERLSAFAGRIERFKHAASCSAYNSRDATRITRSTTKRTGSPGLISDPGILVNGKHHADHEEESTSSPIKAAPLSKSTPRPAKRRRKDIDTSSSRSPKGSPRSSSPINKLRDSLQEGLILVSIGVNPGIMTGLTGEAYSHPSNRYWPTLYASGITPILHKPKDTHDLVELYGMGHTNIVAHIASRAASDLTSKDWMDGAAVLDDKIRRFKPEAVCLVGEGIFQQWFRYKAGRAYNVKKDGPVKFGIQDEKYWIGRKGDYKGAVTWVVTTTSGASTKFSAEERVAIWKPLGDWFAPKRDAWIQMRNEAREQKMNTNDGDKD